MKISYASSLAFKGIRAKPTRTFLTLLGIAIGVAAVIAIASLGAGANHLITDEISGLGADVIAVRPGKEPSGPSDISQMLYADTLIDKDVEALLRSSNVPHAIAVMPMVVVPGSVAYEGETYTPQIIGADAAFFGSMFNVYPADGELFGKDEIREKAQIVVIGAKVKDELFGESSALGEKITIKGNKFTVTGIFPPTGQVAFADFDDMVLLPYTTAQTYLLGISHYNEFIVQVDDPANVPVTTKDIVTTLRERHNLMEGEENDFNVTTPAALMEQVGTILSALTIFLSAVVAIALLVGGIGIMNIMLVSVAERTKEIGLRKAVGATDKDILLQFLLEAMLLTLFGGAVGVMFGAGISYGISIAIRTFSALAWTFIFPINYALFALLFSVVIGLIFGLYPARKASRKSPMEALRYE